MLTETAASTAADKDSLENNDTVKGEVEEERAKMDVDVLAGKHEEKESQYFL